MLASTLVPSYEDQRDATFVRVSIRFNIGLNYH